MITSYPTIKYTLDPGAYPPERAHSTDAGADLRTPIDFTLPSWSSRTIDTGVHVQLPPETCGELWSKSGLNINHGIISTGLISTGIMSTGLVDEGYTGSVKVELYNLSDDDYYFEKGEKITQLVIKHVCYPTYQLVEAIEGGERGSAGIGSTGRL